MTDEKPRRFVPEATPETAHFWEGTRASELRLQRCVDAAHVYFPPRPFCPECGSREVEVFTASGRGRLYSYVIHQRPVRASSRRTRSPWSSSRRGLA